MNQSTPPKYPLSTSQLNSLTLDNPFWQFSLKQWKNESLQKALLSLQDQHNFKINRLLFAMWLGVENKLLEPHLETLEQETSDWQTQVVEPLRSIRKILAKHHLKDCVQEAELQAEQIEQALLFKLSEQIPETVHLNTLYILTHNLFASRLPESHLLLCIQACLPAYSQAHILSCISELK